MSKGGAAWAKLTNRWWKVTITLPPGHRTSQRLRYPRLGYSPRLRPLVSPVSLRSAHLRLCARSARGWRSCTFHIGMSCVTDRSSRPLCLTYALRVGGAHHCFILSPSPP